MVESEKGGQKEWRGMQGDCRREIEGRAEWNEVQSGRQKGEQKRKQG
jgi:hypothetical protein